MAKSFNEILGDLLKTDSRFVDDEGELISNIPGKGILRGLMKY